MSTTVTVSKDEIGEKAFDIANLIGLLDENGDLQTDWFGNPATQLEAAPGRAKALIQTIQSFLGPKAETNAPVFTGAEWYEIRNPSTGNATGFYVVTPQAADAGGLVGLGIQHAIAVGNLSIDFYVFIPIFRINNGGEPDRLSLRENSSSIQWTTIFVNQPNLVARIGLLDEWPSGGSIEVTVNGQLPPITVMTHAGQAPEEINDAIVAGLQARRYVVSVTGYYLVVQQDPSRHSITKVSFRSTDPTLVRSEVRLELLSFTPPPPPPSDNEGPPGGMHL